MTTNTVSRPTDCTVYIHGWQ